MANQILNNNVTVQFGQPACVGNTVISSMVNGGGSFGGLLPGKLENPGSSIISDISVVVQGLIGGIENQPAMKVNVGGQSLSIVYRVTSATPLNNGDVSSDSKAFLVKGTIDGFSTVLANSSGATGALIKAGNSDGYFPVDTDHDKSTTGGSISIGIGSHMVSNPGVGGSSSFSARVNSIDTGRVASNLSISNKSIEHTNRHILSGVRDLYEKYPILKDNYAGVSYSDLPSNLQAQATEQQFNTDVSIKNKLTNEYKQIAQDNAKKFLYSKPENVDMTRHDYITGLARELEVRNKQEIESDNRAMESSIKDPQVQTFSLSSRGSGGGTSFGSGGGGGSVMGARDSMMGAMSSASGYNTTGGVFIGATSIDIESVGSSAISIGKSRYGEYNWASATDVSVNIMGSSASMKARDFVGGTVTTTEDLTGFISSIMVGGVNISVPIYYVQKPSSPWFEYMSTNYNKINGSSNLSSWFMLIIEALPAILSAVGGIWAPAKVGSVIAQGVIETIPPEMKSYVMFSMWIKVFGTDLPYFQDLRTAGWAWSGSKATLTGSYQISTYNGIPDSTMKIQNGVIPHNAGVQSIWGYLTSSQGGCVVQAIGSIPNNLAIPSQALEEFNSKLAGGVIVV